MRLLFVPVLLATASLALGCSARSAAVVEGGDVVSPGQGAPPATPPATVALEDTTVCVVDRASPGGLTAIPAKYAVDRREIVVPDGDRMHDLAEVYRPTAENGYALEETWFSNNAPIRFGGAEYVKYGPRRLIEPGQVEPGGDVRGVPVFLDRLEYVASGTDQRPELLYLAVAPGCIFQPYIREDRLRQIRGE